MPLLRQKGAPTEDEVERAVKADGVLLMAMYEARRLVGEMASFEKPFTLRRGNAQGQRSRDESRSQTTESPAKRQKTSWRERVTVETTAPSLPLAPSLEESTVETSAPSLEELTWKKDWELKDDGGDSDPTDSIKTALENLLNERLLPPTPTINNKKEVLRKQGRPEYFESQTSSQGADLDSQESLFHQAGERKTRCKFRSEATVLQALEYLHQNNSKPSESENAVDEKGHTHYVVNRLLSAIKAPLELLVRTEITNYSGLGETYGETLELAYYEESRHHQDQTERQPDSAFYLVGKESGEPKLTKEAQQIGMLVSLEHKTTLDNQKKVRDAWMECERDYAEKVKETDCLHPPIGYSIITDGIDWIFLRMNVSREKNQHGMMAHKIHTRCSDRINIHKDKANKKGGKDKKRAEKANEDNEDKLNDWDFAILAKWLLFILKQSLVEKEYPMPEKPALDVGTKLQVQRILDLSERRLVAQVSSNGDDNRHFVLKLPMFGFQEKEKGTNWKEARRIEQEKENLATLVDSKGIVSATMLQDVRPYIIHLDYVGCGLDKMIVSGQAGKLLAKEVYKHIWQQALPALRRKNMCHADIHPGNICVADDSGALRATLVDLESARTVGKTLEQSPIKVRDDSLQGFLDKSSFKLDKIMVCSIMASLWEMSLENLADNVTKCAEGYQKQEKGKNYKEPGFVNATIANITRD